MTSAYCWILSSTHSVHWKLSQRIRALGALRVLPRPLSPAPVATRQTSSSGRPKSPRIQVVLPEELCERLSLLADAESRTVSNMAKVLIQQGVERLEQGLHAPPSIAAAASDRLAQAGRAPAGTEVFRDSLERQGSQAQPRLKGAPRRLRLRRPPA